MKNNALFLFIGVSLFEIASHLFNIPQWHQVCKPLIMPSLGLFYFLSVKWSLRAGMVLVAILFSFMGDLFLMFDAADQLYFMLGLGSFLLAHVFYAIVYGKHAVDTENNPLANVQMVRMGLPVVMMGTGLVVILYPVLGDLRIPVIVYALVLMIMVIRALVRYQRTSTQSFIFVFAGALLFMISDSLLAVNKFLQPIGGAGVYIMSTYCLGQGLIIGGLVVHTNRYEKEVRRVI